MTSLVTALHNAANLFTQQNAAAAAQATPSMTVYTSSGTPIGFYRTLNANTATAIFNSAGIIIGTYTPSSLASGTSPSSLSNTITAYDSNGNVIGYFTANNSSTYASLLGSTTNPTSSGMSGASGTSGATPLTGSSGGATNLNPTPQQPMGNTGTSPTNNGTSPTNNSTSPTNNNTQPTNSSTPLLGTPTSTSIYHKWWFWLIVAIVVILIIIAIVAIIYYATRKPKNVSNVKPIVK